MRGLVVAAIALLALMPSVPAPTALAQDATMPEGCAPADGGILCQWAFDTRSPADVAVQESAYLFDIPAFPRTLASIAVRLDGEDRGWRIRLQELDGETYVRDVSVAQHDPDRTQPVGVVQESGAHVFDTEDGLTQRLVFLANSYAVADTSVYGMGPPSLGEFTITYFAREVPAGVAPARPAATRADPHLSDDAHEGIPPAEDIEAAWMDDVRVGDELFDAHVAIANLSDWEDVESRNGALQFTLAFTVRDRAYALTWVLSPSGDFCSLQRAEAASVVTVAYPLCEVDGPVGELSAIVPEESVGSPAIGEPIDLTGATSRVFAITGEEGDEATNVRYPFALGGDAVWSGLNPRLDPPVESRAWWQDPLASENIADTLQVGGAIVAGITTLVGLLLLVRNRRQTRELLHRVDALVGEHEANARAALLALGELEQDFTRLYRDGRINEAQYQLASQRVVAAASRLAVRTQLGLDDGAPA